ncbi:MAG: NAD(P)-dependent oxidoreductase [Methanobrevibacter sp.]|jgi:3-hydroxyisobutyrate dehydrogenase-like beta-hydroxyacid dehydrogenase|nr:NAD(P)-dependent oxidoreductase [Methanobrevibacter sp.]
MIIGFIGYGEVSSALSKILIENGAIVKTSSQERSEKTKERISNCSIEDVESLEELSYSSDILISANIPSKSKYIAKKYGKIAKGIFLDLNNISPNKTEEISDIVGENFVDGAIIGKVDSPNSVIFVSGKNSYKIAILNNFGLNIKVISHNIGDASKIKMLRSVYTKGISAFLIETFKIAENMDLKDQLFKTIAISEGDNFIPSSKSRIKNSLKHSKRKYEEVDEILEFLNKYKKESGKDFNLDLMEAIKNTFKEKKN